VNESGKTPNKLIIGNSPSPFRYSNLSQSLGCFLLHSSLPLLQRERDTLLATSLQCEKSMMNYDILHCLMIYNSLQPHFGYVNHQFLYKHFPNISNKLGSAPPQIPLSPLLTLLTLPTTT